MKQIIKNICSFMCIVLVLSSFTFTFTAEQITTSSEISLNDEKIYSKATIDQEFVDNHVLVVMNRSASAINKTHEFSTVRSVSISKVTDLTQINISKLQTETNSSVFSTERLDEEHALPLVNMDSFRQILLLELPTHSKQNVLDTIKRLEAVEGIRYVGPDYITHSDSTIPNDQLCDVQWVIEKVQLNEAWDISTGANVVRVGVIDSGIASHPDLNANVIEGFDFANDEADTTDDISGHGTHVAGIIGAVGNNVIGVAGTSWNISLVPLQVTDNTGIKASVSDEVAAINYAINNNIPILNYSRGGLDINSEAFRQAVANYQGLFICSAGNKEKDLDVTQYHAASYNLKNMISVANTTSSDELYEFTHPENGPQGSNYGKNVVHLAAPGSNIWSTYLNSGYTSMTGTSMAAPHVAGVAALILSLRPNLTAAEVKALILDNVDKVDALSELCITGGRLNAYKAVRAATEAETFVADVNNDEKSDVILSRNNNGKRQFKVFLGEADGSYYLPKNTNSTYDFSYSDPAYIGDFNGDNYTDILIHWANGENKRQLLVFTGKGDGTFNEGVNLSSTRNHLPNSYPSQFFVGDVNDDGKDDFIVHFRNGDGKRCALVYKGKSTAPYLSDAPTNALTSTNDYRPEEPVFVGDFNGDGRTDMLVHSANVNQKRELFIYTGKLDGNFNARTTLTSVRNHIPHSYPAKFYITDVNGDGKDDFVVHWRNNDGKRCNLVYKGSSTSPYLIDANTNAIESTNTYVETDPVFVGDVNGDGYSDMVVHWVNNGIRQLMTYTAKADGKYNTAVKINTGDTHLGGRFFLADVNGDGRDDFIVKHIDELSGYMNIRIYLGTTSGGFGSGIDSVTGLTPFYDE